MYYFYRQIHVKFPHFRIGRDGLYDLKAFVVVVITWYIVTGGREHVRMHARFRHEVVQCAACGRRRAHHNRASNQVPVLCVRAACEFLRSGLVSLLSWSRLKTPAGRMHPRRGPPSDTRCVLGAYVRSAYDRGTTRGRRALRLRTRRLPTRPLLRRLLPGSRRQAAGHQQPPPPRHLQLAPVAD
jgi:hypothetical protein